MGTDVATTEPGGEVAIPDEPVEGLEDFDTKTDAAMPMLRIKHDSGQFVDGLSGETINKPGEAIEVILLGLIKQRVLWAAEVSDDAMPLCKSYNFLEGVPDEDTFPRKASGFSAEAVESGRLPCEDCKLKDWGSHPQRDTPWCSEQHTFALLYKVGDGWAPALLTVQRSAIKPSRQYLTAFARSKTPLYTVVTSITLDQRRRGTVDFSVPKFVRGAETDQDDWPDYAMTYRGIREFVQTPRSRDDEDEDDDGAPVAAPAKKAAKKAAPAKPKAADTSEAPAEDEEQPDEPDTEAEAEAEVEEEAATAEAAAEGDAPPAAEADAEEDDDDDLPF